MRAWGCVLAGLLTAGCASSSDAIKPAYVSPLQYQNLTCQQIGAEMERVSRGASEAAGVQDSQKTTDAWTTTAAIVIFWPAAFFVKGDAQVNSGDPGAYLEMLTQKRTVDRKRIEIASRIATLAGRTQAD
jgi:hypothetical protein